MQRKELLSVRIPPDLMGDIDALSAKTRRDKTSVTIDLLERGLATLSEAPIKTANYATVEEMQEMGNAIASLRSELESLKELEPAEN